MCLIEKKTITYFYRLIIWEEYCASTLDTTVFHVWQVIFFQLYLLLNVSWIKLLNYKVKSKMIWNYNDKGTHIPLYENRSSDFFSILLVVTTVLIWALTMSHCAHIHLVLTVVLQRAYNNPHCKAEESDSHSWKSHSWWVAKSRFKLRVVWQCPGCWPLCTLLNCCTNKEVLEIIIDLPTLKLQWFKDIKVASCLTTSTYSKKLHFISFLKQD